jgi:hypothetical protein
LDLLDWIHAVALPVPDPRRHLVRFPGVYANRSRRLWQRKARARPLRRILEVDPRLCPRGGVEMKIVAVITEPNAMDAILRSLSHCACRDPFAVRGPPATAAGEATRIL